MALSREFEERNQDHWQATGHAIEILGASTGHTVRTVAYCDTPYRAALLVAAIKSRADMLTALQLSFTRLCELNRDDEAGMRTVIANAITKATGLLP